VKTAEHSSKQAVKTTQQTVKTVERTVKTAEKTAQATAKAAQRAAQSAKAATKTAVGELWQMCEYILPEDGLLWEDHITVRKQLPLVKYLVIQ
jgi:hypothetical protein